MNSGAKSGNRLARYEVFELPLRLLFPLVYLSDESLNGGELPGISHSLRLDLINPSEQAGTESKLGPTEREDVGFFLLPWKHWPFPTLFRQSFFASSQNRKELGKVAGRY